MQKRIYVKNRNQWRQWLIKNQNKKREVWLILYKKHTQKQTIPYTDALDEALCFGWIDSRLKKLDDDRSMIRFTPRSSKSPWSANNVKRYKSLLKRGLVTDMGKEVFKTKSHVYLPKRGAAKWHAENKMSMKPTLQQRIKWHREHQKHCGCRPIPKSLEQYF